MVSNQQLPLPLFCKPALAREDFLVAPCNVNALEFVENIVHWQNNVAVLYGPAGSGKSHLSAVWRHIFNADMISISHLTYSVVAERIGASKGHIVIEFSMEQSEEYDEKALFHLLNDAKERNYHILIVARQPAGLWHIHLPDLKSRLLAISQICIEAPNDELLGALLVKQLGDRGIPIDPRVLNYILPRIERSFEAVSALVHAIDQGSLVRKNAVTIPFIKDFLPAI